MGRRKPKITDREYWPAILERLETMAQDELAPTSASMVIAQEFKCGGETVYNAMQRGDVPSYPSTDRARAQAWQKGHSKYLRGMHCVKCEERVFFTSVGQCVACALAIDKKRIREQKSQLKSARATGGDFYTGACEFAEDKVFVEPQAQQQPLKHGSTQHMMADAMLEGATLDELALLTGWHPHDCQNVFTDLKPKGYGVERRDGHYYLLLAEGVDAIQVNNAKRG